MLPDAPVPEAPFRLRDLRPADEIPQVRLSSDALDDVRLDAAAGAIVPAQAAVPYAEKLAVPALVVQAQAVKSRPARLPEAATALCIPDAAPSAA